MNRAPDEIPAADAEAILLRQASADARALLREVLQGLRSVLRDRYLMKETPMEVCMPMESAVETIRAALARLEATSPSKGSQIDPPTEGPTHRKGQFLAYIREHMSQNAAGLARTHAAMQRFLASRRRRPSRCGSAWRNADSSAVISPCGQGHRGQHPSGPDSAPRTALQILIPLPWDACHEPLIDTRPSNPLEDQRMPPDRFDLNDIAHEPTDEQLNALMKLVAAEANWRAEQARQALMRRLRDDIAAANGHPAAA